MDFAVNRFFITRFSLFFIAIMFFKRRMSGGNRIENKEENKNSESLENILNVRFVLEWSSLKNSRK